MQNFSYLPQMTLEEEMGVNTVFVLVASEKMARRQQEGNCLPRKGATHGPEGLYFLAEIIFLVVMSSYYSDYQLS